MTHSGLQRDYILLKMQDRVLRDFHDKIIHIIVDNMPSTYDEIHGSNISTG